MPKELAAQPPFPQELTYLWQWFLELGSTVNYTEIVNFCLLTGRRLSKLEVRTMIQLDRIRSRPSD